LFEERRRRSPLAVPIASPLSTVSFAATRFYVRRLGVARGADGPAAGWAGSARLPP